MAIYCKAMQLSLRYFFNNTLYVFSLFTDDLSIEYSIYHGYITMDTYIDTVLHGSVIMRKRLDHVYYNHLIFVS